MKIWKRNSLRVIFMHLNENLRNLGNRFKRISEDQPIRNNGKRKGEKGLLKKRILNVIIASLFLIVGCSNPLSDQYFEPITVELNPRLEVDDNGFYHLPLDMSSWQTLHRFSGMVYESDIPKEVQKVYWDASHYWFIGDTLGYAYKRGITDDFEYVLYDSTAITWFEGFEVPTINCCSYSNAEGEVNTMFAPIRTMKSDTVTVWMYFYNNIAEIHVDSFKVILE